VANLFVVEASTCNGNYRPNNGVTLGSLPALAGLSPPTDPKLILAYFSGQNADFYRLQVIPIGNGIIPIDIGYNTDTIAVYSEVNCTVDPGNIPGAPFAITAGITNGQYFQGAALKAN